MGKKQSAQPAVAERWEAKLDRWLDNVNEKAESVLARTGVLAIAERTPLFATDAGLASKPHLHLPRPVAVRPDSSAPQQQPQPRRGVPAWALQPAHAPGAKVPALHLQRGALTSSVPAHSGSRRNGGFLPVVRVCFTFDVRVSPEKELCLKARHFEAQAGPLHTQSSSLPPWMAHLTWGVTSGMHALSTAAGGLAVGVARSVLSALKEALIDMAAQVQGDDNNRGDSTTQTVTSKSAATRAQPQSQPSSKSAAAPQQAAAAPASSSVTGPPRSRQLPATPVMWTMDTPGDSAGTGRVDDTPVAMMPDSAIRNGSAQSTSASTAPVPVEEDDAAVAAAHALVASLLAGTSDDLATLEFSAANRRAARSQLATSAAMASSALDTPLAPGMATLLSAVKGGGGNSSTLGSSAAILASEDALREAARIELARRRGAEGLDSDDSALGAQPLREDDDVVLAWAEPVPTPEGTPAVGQGHHLNVTQQRDAWLQAHTTAVQSAQRRYMDTPETGATSPGSPSYSVLQIR